MNRNRLLLAAVLALSLSWLGCNKSGKLSESSTFTTPTGPVEMKLKWPLGERIVQSMDMKQTVEMALPNKPEPMKQEMQIGQNYSITVVKATPDNGHQLELEFQGARMKMDMGGKTMMDYDSDKKASETKPNPMGDIFGKLVGAKIQYFLDASNEVERLEGVDDLLTRLSDGGGAAAVAPLKAMFNDGSFKQMMSQNRYLPPKPVQPGDTWPVHIETPMGPLGTLAMDLNFTFKSWEMHGKRNCARLDFEGTLKSVPAEKSKSDMMSISGLEGTSAGTSWFDPELGIIIDTSMKQDLTMVMSMKMASMQNMTNHMIQDLSIKLVSVK